MTVGKKPPKPLTRKASLRSRSSGMKRGGTVRKRNPKRRASEFARCYHSRERVRFVKSLGCLVCLAIAPVFYATTAGACDNAHTETDGMGRKAGYDTIVPLCREHHRRYDEHRKPCDRPEVREYLKSMAPKIEQRWLEYANQQGIAA